ncbi:uncharacterized protein LOC128458389 [Pleuronectes platessa]|uniref:uncharacterized protein LOC128458389 n=1 Tax=Pleuronectes platessa TaxID=8262 RepID=UPI00232A0D2F|nr:uncharacterized protein LOC128458389 [Pleuronectes platessa]
MGHSLLCVLSLFWLITLLSCGCTEYAELTFEPNSTTLYSGEHIHFTCHMRETNVSEWSYEFKWNDKPLVPINSTNVLRIPELTPDRNGDYECIAHHNSSEENKWSNRATLSVSARTLKANKPRPTLTANNTTVTGKGSLAMICSVDNAAEWRYDWFKRNSAQILRYNETDDKIRISEEGIYNCRGRRGDTTFLTEDSNLVTIKNRDSHKASVALQPDWSLVFSGEMVTVRCEVPADVLTEWEYEWTKPNSNTVPKHNEYRIVNASSSDSGSYSCLAKDKKNLNSTTEWSDDITLTVYERPAANLSADHRAFPVGGSVLLTCSVGPASHGWNYYWYRGEKTSEPLKDEDFKSNGQSGSASREGLYWCRGGKGYPVYYTQYSNSVGIHGIVNNRAAVTLQPNWPNRYRGETVTLRCEIQGGDSEWEYEWTATSSRAAPNTKAFRMSLGSHLSGSYWCQGRLKGARQNSTGWSVPLTLSNAAAPRPVVTVSPLWLTRGASVTLTCGVPHPTAGWRFYWYRADPTSSYLVRRHRDTLDIQDRLFSMQDRGFPKKRYPQLIFMDILKSIYELLPGSSGGTEQNSFVIQGLTESAGYACRAGRGDPVFYTEYSDPKWVWSLDSNSSVSLTVRPDTVQHFRHDEIHLTCNGNSDKCRFWRFTRDRLSYSQETITSFTWAMEDLPSGVYWCGSGSELSNAVNITTDSDRVILESPVHPVTGGQSVTLGCSWLRRNLDSSFSFYKNGELLQSDVSSKLEISAVSKSDEGFYKCEHSGFFSPERWISVKYSDRVILESPVHPVTGGQSVTLGCSWFRRNLDSSFSFYKNGELLQTDVSSKLEISAVSKSDEGFYKCEHSGFFSPERWISVKSPPCTSPVPLVVGLVGGITLICFLSLLLLCWCRYSKNLCCDRLSQSLRTNQSSDPAVHHNEIQLQLYSSLLHGDECIYESIRGDTEEGTRGDPEETSDYVNENPHSATGPR